MANNKVACHIDFPTFGSGILGIMDKQSCSVRNDSRGNRSAPVGRGSTFILFWVVFLLAGLACLPGAALAQTSEPQKAETAAPEQEAPPDEGPQSTRMSYPVRNGSVTYSRIEESEKRKTADGEVETHRVRMPSWGGTRDVLMEREIRTKKLPDGTVEKEYVLKNPDGGDHMVPIEIIREKIKKSGDTTTTEREVLRPGYDGRWRPARKETVRETGPESARQSVKEVREPTLSGEWKVVDRETTTAKSSGDSKESRTVRQLPDAYGSLADYEVREERSTTEEGKESRAVSVRRRDSQDTDHPKMILVERTVTDRIKSADGKVTTKSVTESDLLAGGATRNVSSSSPQVVEITTEEETPGQDGSGEKVVEVKQRGVVDSGMRPAYQVVQQTDKDGNARQIFIPKAR